ncbi:MAG: PAS domain-containing protein [Desulfurivibrio sp.]|nr:PAS domain-containing protein [Desulfurivibrio sp.]MBU4118434.1 sigma 54-interacting transcriptional regulator [Pseudomonadota bacterium]
METKSTPPSNPAVQEAVFTVDENWQITTFNDAAKNLLGLTAGETIGKTCQDVFSGTGKFEALCSLYGPLASGRAMHNFRVILRKTDSDEATVLLVTAIPIPNKNGKLSGAIITLRDTNDSGQIYPLVLDSIADGVFTVDKRFHITSFNKAAEHITGWTAQEVVGVSCHDIFHSNICGADCILAQSINEGKSIVNRSIYIKGKNKRTIPISISAAPLLDPDGQVIGGVETFRDITSTLQQDLILNSIADGVFTVDRNWQLTSFNKAAEHITGWSKDEVLGKGCSSIFHSSICGDGCILAQSVESGKPIGNRSIFIKGKDGETIPISISAAPLTDPDGEVIGGVETFRDMTSVMTKDLVLESIADGVFTVNRNWEITSFNRAAELITGWKRRDAIGKSCSDVFHSSICGDNCAIAQSLYSGKPVANRSIFVRNAEGKQIPLSISAAPLLDHEGNVIGGVETFRDLSVVTELRKQLSRRYTFGEILSKSASMQRIFDILPEIAHSESNVLVLGESGTGKELVARAIHTSSRRNKGPFMAVNCGALPETLLESELFGYKAGAFTDAKHDRPGRFASAEKGTLFLDEIGDIPASLQVKLLRVLQEKVYEPLGSNKPVKSDVRIIAATNRNLQQFVQEGLFREDLFYRLNVVKIMLPPLRDRMEDIPMLAEHFTKQFSTQQGKDIVGISDEALSILMRYNFPGNIRELENIIEYAFILCHGGFIRPEHLPEPFAPKTQESLQPVGIPLHKPLPLEEIEKHAIFQSLERNNWRRMNTCRELKISKDTLRRKIERYGLKNPFDEELN